MASNVVHMKPRSESRPKNGVASLTEFAPDFDLTDELLHHRDLYAGGTEWISNRTFPSHLLIHAERVKSRTRPAVGINPVLAACIAGGIGRIAAHKSVKRLVKLRSELNSLDPDDISSLSVIYTWLQSLDLPVSRASTRRLNIPVSEVVKNAVASVAYELGSSIASISVIAIMTTLSDQLSTPKRNRASLAASLGRFYDEVEVRRRAAKALIREFG